MNYILEYNEVQRPIKWKHNDTTKSIAGEELLIIQALQYTNRLASVIATKAAPGSRISCRKGAAIFN